MYWKLGKSWPSLESVINYPGFYFINESYPSLSKLHPQDILEPPKFKQFTPCSFLSDPGIIFSNLREIPEPKNPLLYHLFLKPRFNFLLYFLNNLFFKFNFVEFYKHWVKVFSLQISISILRNHKLTKSISFLLYCLILKCVEYFLHKCIFIKRWRLLDLKFLYCSFYNFWL